MVVVSTLPTRHSPHVLCSHLVADAELTRNASMHTIHPQKLARRESGYTPRRVGSIFQDDTGRWCEVASVHRSFGVVPCFSEVLKDLTLLVEHAQKMQDKLSIFQRRV